MRSSKSTRSVRLRTHIGRLTALAAVVAAVCAAWPVAVSARTLHAPARPATAHTVSYDHYSFIIDGRRTYLWSGARALASATCDSGTLSSRAGALSWAVHRRALRLIASAGAGAQSSAPAHRDQAQFSRIIQGATRRGQSVTASAVPGLDSWVGPGGMSLPPIWDTRPRRGRHHPADS